MSRTNILISAAVLAAASLIMMISLLVNSALARAPTAPAKAAHSGAYQPDAGSLSKSTVCSQRGGGGIHC